MTRHGFRCCGVSWEWRGLSVQVKGDRWLWRCPTCDQVLGEIPYNPPADCPVDIPTDVPATAS
jgi:hypothetical protein